MHKLFSKTIVKKQKIRLGTIQIIPDALVSQSPRGEGGVFKVLKLFFNIFWLPVYFIDFVVFKIKLKPYAIFLIIFQLKAIASLIVWLVSKITRFWFKYKKLLKTEHSNQLKKSLFELITMKQNTQQNQYKDVLKKYGIIFFEIVFDSSSWNMNLLLLTFVAWQSELFCCLTVRDRTTTTTTTTTIIEKQPSEAKVRK